MAVSRPAIDVSSYLIDPGPTDLSAPVDVSNLFANDRAVELEIGSGKGLFLFNAASANPSHNFLGIEMSRKYARIAAERLATTNIPNAKIWRGDARLFMARLVPASRLRAVHVYFPDPWWKKRHKKRRVFTDLLAAQIERSLEPGGELSVASDVEEYFALIQSLVAGLPRFEEQRVPTLVTPTNSLDYLTNFERKYRLEGRPIFRARYTLRALDPSG